MNERIRELAFKASNGMLSYDGEGEWRLSQKEVEKFAELIVRECIQCGNVLVKHYIDNHPEQEQAMLLAAIADYSNEIKKHFGVEE